MNVSSVALILIGAASTMVEPRTWYYSCCTTHDSAVPNDSLQPGSISLCSSSRGRIAPSFFHLKPPATHPLFVVLFFPTGHSTCAHPAAQISAFCLAPRHCGDSTTQIGSGISSPCLSLFSQVCLCPAWNGPWKNASSRPAIVDLDRTRMRFLFPFLRF